MIRRILFFAALLLPFTVSTAFNQSANAEFGKATYYSNALHGRKTASGEKYDKAALTCAHKSLPFGTKLRVTRLDNNKSVVVRVNDRGPFASGFVVDISRRAAEQLGMISAGTTRVKIEVIGKEETEKKPSPGSAKVPKPEERSAASKKSSDKTELLRPVAHSTEAPSPAPKESAVTAKNFKSSDLYKIDLKRPEKKGFAVQLGTFSTTANMLREVAKAQDKFPGKVLVQVDAADDGSESYKIVAGPYPDRKAAEKAQANIAKKGYKKCFVVDLATL